MSVIENIAGYIGIFLVFVSVVLLWLVNWMLGLAFTVFVAAVASWYLRTKRKGDLYLREVARITGCEFQGGELGYGRVVGVYKGCRIEVCVNKGYDSLRGLAGFAVSTAVLDSAVGILAGIKNFTSVKVEHGAHVEEPFKLDDRTYVDKHLILYLPPSNGISGLPKISVRSMKRKIDEIVKKAEQIESSHPLDHQV